jgi:GMP synthase-like glutamine amidotransferase
MPRCLVIQHVSPEGSFTIEESLVAAGVAVETCRVFEGEVIPADLTGFGGLVVMGGPMSADADDRFPTRTRELALIRDGLGRGIPTLGVCLGAQLLALAAGGSVHRGSAGPEIGWSEVSLSEACRSDLLFADLPSSLEVLQWHGDTFDLPPVSSLLASNGVYAHQAFRVGTAAWGLQFHIEVDAGAVTGFLDAFAADAESIPGGPEGIRSATPDALDRLAPARNLLLSRFAQLVAAGVNEEDLVGSG